ncbi:uncharacterized protein LOC141609151 [Silene latifolia]|uniref:uncharacterized protein LOC141609151 n=1 Tax=Silene latifolia TaxID=37657 RepID=UPI003D780D04
MAEPSIPNKPTSETHQTAPTMDESEQNRKAYDFAFILKPAKTLKIAVEAFSDPKLNKDMEALIQVGPNGFETTVWNVDMDTGNEVFVMLRFMSAGLEDFQCSKPLRKMLPLKGLSKVVRAADEFNPESEGVAIFVEQGSNRISFQWGSSALDFALGRPVNIDLKEADADYQNFTNISYMYETVVASKDLPTMMTRLPEDFSFMGAQIVEMMIGEEEEEYRIQMEWSFWKSLESASGIAENCTVCLIGEPDKYVMLRFKLGEFGDMVILNEADFVYAPDLPIKGHFHSLH